MSIKVYYFTILSTILLIVLAAGDSGHSITNDLPKIFPSLGSIGRDPKRGIFANSASDSPPPLLKIFVQSEQYGQTNLKKEKHVKFYYNIKYQKYKILRINTILIQ